MEFLPAPFLQLAHHSTARAVGEVASCDCRHNYRFHPQKCRTSPDGIFRLVPGTWRTGIASSAPPLFELQKLQELQELQKVPKH